MDSAASRCLAQTATVVAMAKPARRLYRQWPTVMISLVGFAVLPLLLAGCSVTRPLDITLDCETDMLVDWLYIHDEGEVLTEDWKIRAGTNTYRVAADTKAIEIQADGETLASSVLPSDQADPGGDNPMPPMTIPATACSLFTPVASE